MSRARKGQARQVHLMITALGPGQDMTFQLCRREDRGREKLTSRRDQMDHKVLLTQIPHSLLLSKDPHTTPMYLCGSRMESSPFQPQLWVAGSVLQRILGHTGPDGSRKQGVHEPRTQCGASGCLGGLSFQVKGAEDCMVVEKSGSVSSQRLHMDHLCSLPEQLHKQLPYSRSGSNQVQGVAS